MEKDSITAMINEARQQGWLVQDQLAFIPEIMNIYSQASEYFLDLIAEEDPQYRQTLVYHTCRYLFAKAVEGVILWGPSPGGEISVYFHPKHLVGELKTEVPSHLHQTVIESQEVGESLFRAHKDWIIECQEKGVSLDLSDEIRKTIEWIPRFGISYALQKNYHAMR